MCDVYGDLHLLAQNNTRTQITRDIIVPLPNGLECNQDVQTGTDGALYFVDGGGYSTATLYRVVP